MFGAPKEEYALSSVLSPQKHRVVIPFNTPDTALLLCGGSDGRITAYRRDPVTNKFDSYSPNNTSDPIFIAPGAVFSLVKLTADEGPSGAMVASSASSSSSSSAGISKYYPPGYDLAVGTDQGQIIVFASGIGTGSTSSLEPIHLIGHQQPVSSLAVLSDGSLVSGAWDGTVRIWRGTETVATIEGIGHAYNVYVASILHAQGPGVDLIAVGSSGKLLSIHEFDTATGSLRTVKQIPNAHPAVIRKVRRHPLGFASCGNDGMVKLWTSTGEFVSEFVATEATGTIDSITYDLCVDAEHSRAWVTSDDNIVRCFTLNGESLIASLLLPSAALSVCPAIVPASPDEVDVALASNAGLWVVTGSRARYADREVMSIFNASATQARDARMDVESIPLDGLPTVEVLLKPGNPQGEKPLIVNVDGRPMVFLWNQDAMEWQLQGEAIGKKKPAKKQMHIDGKEYDHIIKVDVSDQIPPIPLAFNREDDPDDIATEFIARHGLDVSFKQQIVDFITPHIDMHAVSRKRAAASASDRSGASMAAGASSAAFEPAWVVETMKTHTNVREKLMYDAIIRRSDEFAADASTQHLALTTDEKKMLESIVSCATTVTRVEPTPLPQGTAAFICKLLAWPTAKVAPCVDLLRSLLANPIFIGELVLPEDITSQEEVNQLLSPGRLGTAAPSVHRRACTVTTATTLGQVCDAFSAQVETILRGTDSLTNQMVGPAALAIQAIANYVAKRPAIAPEERSRTSSPMSVTGYITVLHAAATRSAIAAANYINAGRTPGPALHILDAYATLALNTVIWMGRLRGLNTSPMWTNVGAGIIALLIHPPVRAAISQQTYYLLVLSLLSIFIGSVPAVHLSLLEATGRLVLGLQHDQGPLGALARAFKERMSK